MTREEYRAKYQAITAEADANHKKIHELRIKATDLNRQIMELHDEWMNEIAPYKIGTRLHIKREAHWNGCYYLRAIDANVQITSICEVQNGYFDFTCRKVSKNGNVATSAPYYEFRTDAQGFPVNEEILDF